MNTEMKAWAERRMHWLQTTGVIERGPWIKTDDDDDGYEGCSVVGETPRKRDAEEEGVTPRKGETRERGCDAEEEGVTPRKGETRGRERTWSRVRKGKARQGKSPVR